MTKTFGEISEKIELLADRVQQQVIRGLRKNTARAIDDLVDNQHKGGRFIRRDTQKNDD